MRYYGFELGANTEKIKENANVRKDFQKRRGMTDIATFVVSELFWCETFNFALRGH